MSINKLNDRVTFLDLLNKTNETATTVNNSTVIGSSYITDMLQATGDYINVDSFGEIDTLYTKEQLNACRYTAPYDGILYLVFRPSGTINSGDYLVGVNTTLGIRPCAYHPYNGWNYVTIPLRKNDIASIETSLNHTLILAKFYKVQPSQTALDLVSKSNALNEKLQSTSTILTSNIIKYGNLYDCNGIISGFTGNKKIRGQLPIEFVTNGKPFECCIKLTTNSNIDSKQRIFQCGGAFYGFYLMLQDKHWLVAASSNGSTWDLYHGYGTATIQPNKSYILKYSYDGTKHILSYRDYENDNKTFIDDIIINNSNPIKDYSTYLFGVPEHESQDNDIFKGSIDLKESYITIDGNLVWQGVNVSQVNILDILYPVGSIYIGTMAVCPMQVLGVGTWRLIAGDKVLQSAGTRGNAGQTLNESLPNIKGSMTTGVYYSPYPNTPSMQGALSKAYVTDWTLQKYTSAQSDQFHDTGVNFNANNSSSVYQDNAPVQQDAYVVNIWERIS